MTTKQDDYRIGAFDRLRPHFPAIERALQRRIEMVTDPTESVRARDAVRVAESVALDLEWEDDGGGHGERLPHTLVLLGGRLLLFWGGSLVYAEALLSLGNFVTGIGLWRIPRDEKGRLELTLEANTGEAGENALPSAGLYADLVAGVYNLFGHLVWRRLDP